MSKGYYKMTKKANGKIREIREGQVKRWSGKEVLKMLKHFTLEYWIDDSWYVGRLKEISGVFSQGQTLDDLEKKIFKKHTN